MSSPCEDLLRDIHSKFAEKCRELLEKGDVSPQALNVIRQFLKDNGIDATPQQSKPLTDLLKLIPADLPEDAYEPTS